MTEDLLAADMVAEAAAAYKEYESREANDFMPFVLSLIIPSANGPQRFDNCIEPFQLEFFETVTPSLQAVRDGEMPPIRRFWVERTKKAAKDSDVAICLLWLMAYPTRPLKCQICAANQKQAGIIRQRILDLVYYNPWLSNLVEVQLHTVISRRMPQTVWTRIEATDSKGGAHGETPDLLVLNELVHVAKWQAMEDHMHNADGVPRGVVVVATNAGIKGTKAWVWRKNARVTGSRWWMQIWDRKSPWLDDVDIEDARSRDPVGAEFARLFGGRWISGVGNAVDEDSINRCFRPGNPSGAVKPGWRYLGGLDLGVSHDHSGVVVLGVDQQNQMLEVCFAKGWEPSVPNDKGKLEVDLTDVENTCSLLARKYNMGWFGYDPAAGGSFMAQRLRKRGVPMAEMSFASPKNTTGMAQCFVQMMKDGRLICHEGDGRLRRDFGKFSIVHKPPSNYKLEAVSDEFGHADVGTALVICLPKAVEMIGWSGMYDVDDEPVDLDAPLTKEEVKEMPDVLRGVYEMYGDEEKDRNRFSGFPGIDIDDEGVPRRRRNRAGAS